MDEIQEAAIVEANLDALPEEAAAEAILQAITGYSEKAIAIALRRLGGGGGGTQTVYVGDEDPGAVGVGKIWVQTTAIVEDGPSLRMRNGADDGWDQAWAVGGDLLLNGNTIYGSLQGALTDDGARLNLGTSPSSTARLDGGAGLEGAPGGYAQISGGPGDDYTTDGGSFYAQGGRPDGVTHGRVQILTDTSTGTIGQVLMADGNGYAYWADLP